MGNNTVKKKKGMQIGNFIVTTETGDLNSVKVTATSGNWNIRYRQDNIVYAWIVEGLKSEEGKETLHLAFSCWFAACCGVPDAEFLKDVVDAYTRSADRMRESVKKLSDNADNEIIKEEKENFQAKNANPT